MFVECINIGDTEVSVACPVVELQKCETIAVNPLYQAEEDRPPDQVAEFTGSLTLFAYKIQEKPTEIKKLNDKM